MHGKDTWAAKGDYQLILQMNGPQPTAVSRIELRQKQRQKTGEDKIGTDNWQLLFSPGCKQPLRDNKYKY